MTAASERGRVMGVQLMTRTRRVARTRAHATSTPHACDDADDCVAVVAQAVTERLEQPQLLQRSQAGEALRQRLEAVQAVRTWQRIGGGLAEA
jgi:hypothetical protein